MTFAFNPSGGSIAIGYGAMTLVATAAVLLRFRARRLASVRPGPDDHLAAATLLLNYGLLATTVAALGTGDLGAPARGDDAVVTALFKCLLAFNFLYGAAAALTKLAVLALYRRVFPTAFMRRGCAALAALSLLHGLAFLVVTAVQCVPLRLFWESWLHDDDGGEDSETRSSLLLLPPLLLQGRGLQGQGQGQGSCIDVLLFYTAMSVPNAVIDALVLCLPVRETLRLQTSRGKKAAICGVFGLGGIVVIASAARVNAMVRWYGQGLNSATENISGPWAAAVVEIVAAIVGACLPVLPPVWYRCFRRTRQRLSQHSCGQWRQHHHRRHQQQQEQQHQQHQQRGAGCSSEPIDRAAAGCGCDESSHHHHHQPWCSSGGGDGGRWRSRSGSAKSRASAAVRSIVTIGRISSHRRNVNNNHDCTRLTLTDTAFELDRTRLDRVVDPVRGEAGLPGVVSGPEGVQQQHERDADARGNPQSSEADIVDRRAGTESTLDEEVERMQQRDHEKEVVNPVGTAT